MKKITDDPKKRIVVVLGAGRTGTSLLMQILNKLGMTVSEVMTPPSEQNPVGAYEDSDVFNIQSELLSIIETNQLIPLPEHWLDHPGIKTHRNRLANHITDRIANSPTIWGVKDPRTALFLPLWQRIFNPQKIVPVYLLAVREPAATVSSLRKQYNQKESISELFWLHKNCAALNHTGNNCYIVHYEDWFTRPYELAESLLKYTGLDEFFTGDVDEVIKDAIKPNLNRSIYDDYQVQNQYVRKLYGVLKQSRGDEFDRIGLMEVVNMCRQAMDEFKGWYIEAHRHIGQQAAFRLKIQDLDRKLKEANRRSDDLILKAEAAQRKNNGLTGELDRTRQIKNDLAETVEKVRCNAEGLARELDVERKLAREGELIRRSLSYKLGNTVVLAFKEPGWRTVRLPYDLVKVTARSFMNPKEKITEGKGGPHRKTRIVDKTTSPPPKSTRQVDAGIRNELQKALQQRTSLTQAYAQCENRIEALEGQVGNGDKGPLKDLSSQLTDAILLSSNIRMELKDIEDEILGLKIQSLEQK